MLRFNQPAGRFNALANKVSSPMKNRKQHSRIAGRHIFGFLVFFAGAFTSVQVHGYNYPSASYTISGSLLTVPKVNAGFRLGVFRSGGGGFEVPTSLYYQASGLSSGTYAVTVWRDSNQNGSLDDWEEFGSLSGIVVPPSQTGVDISMTAPDNDTDGMPDWWEYEYFGDTTNELPSADWDSDGLTNLDEYQHGSSPLTSDSDSDGIPDAIEANLQGTTGEDGILVVLPGDEYRHMTEPDLNLNSYGAYGSQ